MRGAIAIAADGPILSRPSRAPTYVALTPSSPVVGTLEDSHGRLTIESLPIAAVPMSADLRNAGQIPWKRVVVEGLAIILSILLAFGIDAAWDASQERAKEREYLAALRVEMVLASEELAEDHGRRDRWLAWSDSILDEASGRTVPDSVVNVWIQQVGMLMTRFFPPSAVLNDLLSSGSLSILTSTDVRFSLLAYQQHRERVNFMEDWAREVDEDGLRPYLTENFRWTSEVPLPLTPDGRLPRDPLQPVRIPDGALNAMLSDPIFQNLILVKRQRLGILQRRSAELANLIDELIALLDP